MSHDDPVASPDLFGERHYRPAGVLAQRYGANPFDVFDGRTEEWKERKRQWLAMGLASEQGREAQPGWNTRAHSNGLGEWLRQVDNVGSRTDSAHGWRTGHDVSIFDPVLTEHIVKLWSSPGDMVVDPFSGGSVRGIVASLLLRRYFGVDLRSEQVAANREQGLKLSANSAAWTVGDAREVTPPRHSLLLTCPPYGSLEKYSDDPKCLANIQQFGPFVEELTSIILRWSERTVAGGWVVLVVNNYREKAHGTYTALRPLASELVVRLSRHLEFAEQCAFLTPLGTVPVRASHNWRTGSKLGRCWQQILVWRVR